MAPVLTIRDIIPGEQSSVVSPETSNELPMFLGVLVPFLLVASAIPIIMIKKNINLRRILSTSVNIRTSSSVVETVTSSEEAEFSLKQAGTDVTDDNVKIVIEEVGSEQPCQPEVGRTPKSSLETSIPSVSLSSLTSIICDYSTGSKSAVTHNVIDSKGKAPPTNSADARDVDRLLRGEISADHSSVADPVIAASLSRHTRKLISLIVVENWAIERWWSMFKQASATVMATSRD